MSKAKLHRQANSFSSEATAPDNEQISSKDDASPALAGPNQADVGDNFDDDADCYILPSYLADVNIEKLLEQANSSQSEPNAEKEQISSKDNASCSLDDEDNFEGDTDSTYSMPSEEDVSTSLSESSEYEVPAKKGNNH